MTATVTLDRVDKRYGRQAAVRDVSIELEAGRCFALVGHNGAGKTTLIKLMLGLARPSAGTVRVLGEDPLTRAGWHARAAVGYLPENVVFPPALTGLEMLRFYARLKRRPEAECDALMEQVGLAGAARRRIGTYSKGMRQRLGLAQALLGAPRLLLLDEPTTGLDPLLRQHFYDIVAALRERGVSVLLSSHALTEFEARVDRVIVMHLGRVVAAGSLEALRHMAQLPTRLRLRFVNGFAEALPDDIARLASTTRMADGALELACAEADKLALLRRVTALNGLADVEIFPPSLDQLYARFLESRESDGGGSRGAAP